MVDYICRDPLRNIPGSPGARPLRYPLELYFSSPACTYSARWLGRLPLLLLVELTTTRTAPLPAEEEEYQEARVARRGRIFDR